MNTHSCFTRIAVPLAAIALGLSLPALAFARGKLNLQETAPFVRDLSVAKAVRSECDLPHEVPNYVRAYAKKEFDVELVESVTPHSRGQGLAMTIVGVQARPGGEFTGHKSITVEGKLWEDGRVIGTFRAMRETRGTFATCGSLRYDARSMGKDIAKWLKKPTMDARLGDAR